MTLTHSPCLPSPSDHICSLLRARARELAVLPEVVSEALGLIKNPDADVQKISRLLERDIHLATEILRLANSPAFGGSRDISRLSDAVIRLGLDRCQDLILSSCTANLMKRVSVEQQWIRDALWQHGYATGLCCQILNASLDFHFTGEEFTAGLIHDIGRLLLAVLIPTEFSDGDPMDFNESHDPRKREQSVFDTDHAELGSWFAEQNRLPISLVDVIRHHHDPEQSPRNATLVALVAAADQMSNHFLRHESADGFDLGQRLRRIPRIQQGTVPCSDATCGAILTLAWNRVQDSPAFSL